MIVSTAKGATPILLGPNLLTREALQNGDLIAGGGAQALAYRLYDNDPASIWSTIGANNDTVQVTIVGGFWKQGAQVNVDIDTICVLNHNLKDFTIELSNDNGATYPTLYAFNALTGAVTISTVANVVTANKFRITMQTTQVANSEKQIGCLIFAGAIMQLSVPLENLKKPAAMVFDKSARMHDGSLRRSYRMRSDASIEFARYALKASALVDPEASTLESALKSSKPFFLCVEPYEKPLAWKFGMAKPNTVVRDYMVGSKSGGEFVSFDFEEAGGA